MAVFTSRVILFLFVLSGAASYFYGNILFRNTALMQNSDFTPNDPDGFAHKAMFAVGAFLRAAVNGLLHNEPPEI